MGSLVLEPVCAVAYGSGRAMAFVPPDFAVPRRLRTPLFDLTPLGPQHAEADYDAVMSSRPRLQRYQGRSRRELGAQQSSAAELGDTWPHATMSLEYNRADLAAHSEEFARRMAFAFTVFRPDSDHCLGCIYVNPCPKAAHDAQVTLWLRDSAAHLDGELYAITKGWLLGADWASAGWKSVGWPGRVESFDEWEALADIPAEDFAAMRLTRFGGSVASSAPPEEAAPPPASASAASHELRTEELRFVVGDNSGVPQGPSQGPRGEHLAGYNGVWHLSSVHDRRPLFLPDVCGMNVRDKELLVVELFALWLIVRVPAV